MSGGKKAAQVVPRVAEGSRKPQRQAPWPSLAQEALYGLPGRFVESLDPHTESDRAAVLLQLLAAFGNCIGRGPHFRAEADLHHTNLYGVLVGETSKARKGSSWGHVKRALRTVDKEWVSKCTPEGLSSGEGLIWQVRDPITAPGKGKKKVLDPGVEDKRLFVVESEYSGVFQVMSRQGNTLSPIIRRAWDGGDLAALTKNSPARATGAHISIIGHITIHELRRHLTETEAASGFGNRHLFACVRRSKCLPDGGLWPEEESAEFCAELADAVGFARELGDFELERSEKAREIWHAVYPALSEGKPGMAGALTARGEAQVMRLAVLYALLDLSVEVEADHLCAAIALWEFCEASVTHVFGPSLGDPVCDTILCALEERGTMSRTQIRDLFGRHAAKVDVDRALQVLRNLGIAEVTPKKTGGRPIEAWRLKDGQ